ncbi:MAG: hypothetical protein KDD60_11605, partial [Bdellovibrionales bacterium]|nr:hypothetical protein [Bdellovibrionales bacterium]
LSLKYYKLEGDAETEEVKNELKRAEYGIVNTLNKCYYEAGNFRKMKDVRARTPQGFPRLPTGKKPKKELSEACHDSIDVLLADHWMNYSSTSNSSELQRVGNKIQAQIAKSGIERRGTLYPEAHLRATYLEHEIELGFHSSVGCRPLRDAVSSSVPLREEDLRNHQIKLRKHREIIVGAIDFAREEYRINKEWEPRSPILEQSFDHGLFIPYRSLFMILSGRYRTIEGVDRVNLLRATMAKDGQSVDRQNWDVDFREALRDFSSAHGGVGEENSILKAIADIAAAETCMQMSRSLYLMQSAQDDTTGRKVCDAVDAKLRSASGYLWRAAESLASAPQYVFVWKFHYVAQASYHIERTLWNMLGAFVSYKSTATIRGTESRRQMMEAGNLLDRARRGLAAIRSGLDHTAQDEDRFKAEWRYQWGRLACTSVAAAMLRKLISEARPFDTVHDSVSTSKLGG